MVRPDDEVFAITSNGGVIRTRASEVRQTGRVTMGVRLMNLASGDTVVALARNAESEVAADIENAATTDDIADDGNESGDVDV
jgi:DNA gyrase subunit A